VARRLPGPPAAILASGSGEFLAPVVLGQQEVFPSCPLLSLAQKLGPNVSMAACAHAVAVLCREAEG
jgi:hypothetical protein